MRNKADLVFNIILLAFFLMLLVITFGYGTAARIVPLIVLIPGVVLALFRIAVNLRSLKEQHTSTSEGDEAEKLTLNRKFFIMVLWVVALIVAIWLLGFYVGTTVYIFLYLIMHKEKWMLSTSMALGNFAVFYIIFNQLSKIALYKGQLFIILMRQGIYLPF